MKFILTKELGRLAKWLRILGYDASYFEEPNLSSLIIISLREGRMILTRNSRLRQHHGLKMVYIKSDDLSQQLEQVKEELRLRPHKEKMFSRCVLCNKILKDVRKSEVKKKVPEFVFQTQENFVKCPQCDRVYWQGTHWGKVEQYLKKMIG